jgi:hypothetical protein
LRRSSASGEATYWAGMARSPSAHVGDADGVLCALRFRDVFVCGFLERARAALDFIAAVADLDFLRALRGVSDLPEAARFVAAERCAASGRLAAVCAALSFPARAEASTEARAAPTATHMRPVGIGLALVHSMPDCAAVRI